MIIAAGKERLPIVKKGIYYAKLVGLIDLGLQRIEKFNKTNRLVRMCFELLGETYEVNEETKGRQVAKEFPLFLSEKANLRKFLESWRGEGFTANELAGFDLRGMMGKTAQIQIAHKEGKNGEYAVIDSIMAVPEGTKLPKSICDEVYFDLEDPETYGEYELFPDFLKEKISKAENFGATGLKYGEELDVDEDENRFAKPASAAPAKTAPSKAAPDAKEPVEEINLDDDLSFEVNAA